MRKLCIAAIQLLKDLVVDVCVHGMIENCQIYRENLSFSCFSRLIEVARRTNYQLKDLEIQFANTSKKRLMITTVEKNKRFKASNLQKMSYGKK